MSNNGRFDDPLRPGQGGFDPTRPMTRGGQDTEPTRILGDRGAGTPFDGRSAAPPGAGGTRPAGNDTQFFAVPPGAAPTGASKNPVVGWLVVLSGPGRGFSREVRYGQNAIGRGLDQHIVLDFGDQKISRETHAYIIYDELQRKYFLRDNGKSNLVRHKGGLVMAPVELVDRDEITIGDTALVFVAFCNAGFDWLVDNAQSKA